jgi:hypothetical protein
MKHGLVRLEPPADLTAAVDCPSVTSFASCANRGHLYFARSGDISTWGLQPRKFS